MLTSERKTVNNKVTSFHLQGSESNITQANNETAASLIHLEEAHKIDLPSIQLKISKRVILNGDIKRRSKSSTVLKHIEDEDSLSSTHIKINEIINSTK